jgi:putative glutamine amidotransferase
VEKIGVGLREAARAPDGVVEAVEGGGPDQFLIGVQWHPERIWESEQLSARLFTELVKAAADWRLAKAGSSRGTVATL